MRNTPQDRIKFTALEITGTRQGNISANVEFSLGKRTTTTLGSVTLPVQPTIK